jgi:hypothetical protein
MTDTIQIKGLDRLKIKLGYIPPGMKAGVKAATLHVKGKIAKYPPSTAANQPKVYHAGQWNTWYERGWGTKWATASGSWKGKKSSEMLGKKWTIEMRNDGLTGVVGNNVSYGPYVQDTERQAAPLKRIGWKTTGQVVDEERETVLKFIQDEIENALKK